MNEWMNFPSVIYSFKTLTITYCQQPSMCPWTLVPNFLLFLLSFFFVLIMFLCSCFCVCGVFVHKGILLYESLWWWLCKFHFYSCLASLPSLSFSSHFDVYALTSLCTPLIVLSLPVVLSRFSYFKGFFLPHLV